ADPVIVVTGPAEPALAAELAGLPVTIAENPEPEAGLSASLRSGLAALPPGADGVLVCLGDMPFVRAADLDTLIAAFAEAAPEAIVVPMHEGRRGNPVLFGRSFFRDMQALEGDVGARGLIGRHAGAVREVAIGHDGILADIDTPEGLAAARARGIDKPPPLGR
ncbi:MAG: nucleotidyltransferase family protein, partial [Alphaproteobacteria bacterium]|nr:nucleotidyltransferase family protein [Alphaproteobacteria bacterium]